MGVIIAIDGPAGSGKGTIAKNIAKERGFLYVDTGALYRLVALKCIKEDINYEDYESIKKILSNIKTTAKSDHGVFRVFMDGVEVTKDIRTPEVDSYVPHIAKLVFVREEVLAIQNGFVENHNIVIEGRDICTCVFPNAEVKMFLDASIESRAKRRYNQNIELGIESNYDEIKENLEARNKMDIERTVAPLKCAADAYYIDSSELSIEEVMNKVNKEIDSKIGHLFYGEGKVSETLNYDAPVGS